MLFRSRLPRWMRHPRVYPSGSYRGRQSPPPNAYLKRNSEYIEPATVRDRQVYLSIISVSDSQSCDANSIQPLLTHKRLAPLPRFDPFVRMRSESLSSILDVVHVLHLPSADTAGPLLPRLRKCRTTGNMKQEYGNAEKASRYSRHQDLRRHLGGGVASRTVF